MNTRMFKNGFQSAMILVVVAILGLAAGTLIRDLMQASSGDFGTKVVTNEQPDNKVEVSKPIDQAKVNTKTPHTPQTSNGPEVSQAPEIPQFDILRVEKDGGVLVAGRTQPNNSVEIVRSTGEVLGKVTAKRNGDFVVTLDKQLTRGEHILNLASTDENGAKTESVQTGVVFIPGTSGEVLALINQDGKASRVATMPESLKSKPVQIATGDTTSDENVSTTKLTPNRTATTIEKYPLQVEAVEVEGKNVFVAGAVAPAALVRIYIDNVPVGTVRGTADHRFLLEKTFDLAEGEHIVRADVINEKTGGVWSRVVVDLKHEVPKELLNVAGNKGVELKATDVAKQVNSTKINNAATQLENIEAVKTETLKGGEIGADATVANVDVVKQSPVVETTTTVVKTAKVETSKADSTKVEAPSQASDTSVKISDTKPTTPVITEKVVPVAPEKVVSVVPKKVAPVVPKNVVLVTPKNVEPVAQNKTETNVPKQIETTTAETIEVTKIQTGRSIIIKWGDSLWRISRRTYGRGIRYTTIYNANRSQISDPNKIYVGQVFKLPTKADL